MSLKSIEMQVALPRTFDAQKIHDELAQRGQVINDHAEQKMKKDEFKASSSVLKQEEMVKTRLNQDEKDSKNFKEKKERNNKKNQKQSREKHPYKGNFLDFSG